MNECIFCKIVNGEVPSHKVWEDQNVLAFLDLNASTRGHTLVIPKKHHENIFDISEEEMANIGVGAKKVADLLKKNLNCDGINLVNSNGEVAQQEIMHYHIHVIPRYQGENYKIKFGSEFKDEDLQKTAKEIRGESPKGVPEEVNRQK